MTPNDDIMGVETWRSRNKPSSETSLSMSDTRVWNEYMRWRVLCHCMHVHGPEHIGILSTDGLLYNAVEQTTDDDACHIDGTTTGWQFIIEATRLVLHLTTCL